MNDTSKSLLSDIPRVSLVEIKEVTDGRVVVLFKLNSSNKSVNIKFKETINTLTSTMGGESVYFGNFYGSETIDFFLNIESTKGNIVDKLTYIRGILLKANQLVDNKASLVSFTMEVNLSVKFATYSYLSYLPQYFNNLGIPVCIQSSMVDELIRVSILQMNKGNSRELKSALGTFLLLPSMSDLLLGISDSSTTELCKEIKLYQQKLLSAGVGENLLELGSSEASSLSNKRDEPIELFGGYVKIPALDFYGIEINIPRIVNDIKTRRESNS
ncbi:hypothetical protein [Oceanisphaera sp.]|uniref:hypothetical protein n=1 Tax=Oceanisphaera sp. TaxID=1929979 RepID=UPI003A901E44